MKCGDVDNDEHRQLTTAWSWIEEECLKHKAHL